jgi:hypothetical protein
MAEADTQIKSMTFKWYEFNRFAQSPNNPTKTATVETVEIKIHFAESKMEAILSG